MNIDPLAIAQIFLKSILLIGLGVYAIFAGIMVRQEHLMGDVLEESFEPFLRILVYIHLTASVGLFFLAMIIL